MSTEELTLASRTSMTVWGWLSSEKIAFLQERNLFKPL
jgi:hypothetical protein